MQVVRFIILIVMIYSSSFVEAHDNIDINLGNIDGDDGVAHEYVETVVQDLGSVPQEIRALMRKQIPTDIREEVKYYDDDGNFIRKGSKTPKHSAVVTTPKGHGDHQNYAMYIYKDSDLVGISHIRQKERGGDVELNKHFLEGNAGGKIRDNVALMRKHLKNNGIKPSLNEEHRRFFSKSSSYENFTGKKIKYFEKDEVHSPSSSVRSPKTISGGSDFYKETVSGGIGAGNSAEDKKNKAEDKKKAEDEKKKAEDKKKAAAEKAREDQQNKKYNTGGYMFTEEQALEAQEEDRLKKDGKNQSNWFTRRFDESKIVAEEFRRKQLRKLFD